MVFNIGDRELERNGKKMKSDRASLLQSWSPITESQYFTISRNKKIKNKLYSMWLHKSLFLKT